MKTSNICWIQTDDGHSGPKRSHNRVTSSSNPSDCSPCHRISQIPSTQRHYFCPSGHPHPRLSTHMAVGISVLASRTKLGMQCSSSLHPFQKGNCGEGGRRKTVTFSRINKAKEEVFLLTGAYLLFLAFLSLFSDFVYFSPTALQPFCALRLLYTPKSLLVQKLHRLF